MHFNVTLLVMVPAWCGLGVVLIVIKDYRRGLRTAAERRCHEALRRLSES